MKKKIPKTTPEEKAYSEALAAEVRRRLEKRKAAERQAAERRASS